MTDIIAPGSDATREDLWRDLIAARAEVGRLKIENNERVVKLLAQIVAMQAENERLQTRYDSAADQAVRYADEIERLTALLGKLRWKSIDKDNMEFRCDTTCYVMDEIRRALEHKP